VTYEGEKREGETSGEKYVGVAHWGKEVEESQNSADSQGGGQCRAKWGAGGSPGVDHS
jgi:hypothetical protein